jgi:hypothetical protein
MNACSRQLAFAMACLLSAVVLGCGSDDAPSAASSGSHTAHGATRSAANGDNDRDAGLPPSTAARDAASGIEEPPLDAAVRGARPDAGVFMDAGVRADTDAAEIKLTIGTTTVLAPLAGRMYTPPSDQRNIGFYATDLGISVAHKGALQLLFGDTWGNAQGAAIDPSNDDVQAQLSLGDFPNGDALDKFVAAHPALAGQPPWQAAGPALQFLTKDGKIAPLVPYRDGMTLSMGLGRTPVAAWSDGRDGLYALFLRQTALPCASPSNPTCPDGFVCDTGMGTFLASQGDGALVCVLDQDSGCIAAPSGGFCQDRSSSVYDTSAAGRRLSVVYQQELGTLDSSQEGRYLTQIWNTNKFINPSARSVADFDPTRKRGVGNVYSAATGAGSREKVFIWGRPWFTGVRARHHDARLYFQYIDMPTYSATGQFSLQSHYFTGVVDGVPQFSAHQIDAKPLDLSYPDGDPATEVWDVVGQISVAFVAQLNKWVMFYGGDLTELPLMVMQGPESDAVQHDPEGAIHVRFADQPWGPWSAPEQLLLGSTRDGKAAALPSAPAGIVRRPDCSGSACPPHESNYSADERGFLYAANIIPEWTSARDHGVDIYWNVSTWDPYQVVLLKTRIGR